MKLVLAIISDNLIGDILKGLSKNGFKSTKLSSTGGFMKKGNTTLLLGLDDEQVEKCIEVLRKTIECSDKREKEEKIADANIFVLPMSEMRRM